MKLVCDLKEGTVEYVVEDRTQESLERYYRQFTAEELAAVKAVAMDMWDPFIAATTPSPVGLLLRSSLGTLEGGHEGAARGNF